MASARKPRIANRRSGKATEGAAEKDEGSGSYKNRQRKRKLSDMLGPQWSKEELGIFYEAYRKYTKDWKKVAAAIRNRTIEMVEALYNLNRAYLSLPDGTASAAGLIAMMIDHYNILEGSNSDRDSTEGLGVSGRPQKQTRLKNKLSSTNNFDGCYSDLLQCRSGPSNYGCPSPVKKRRSGGSRPRVVGKRTPRFPVSYTLEKQKSEAVVLSKEEPISDGDCDDYEVAKAVALTLAEASQRVASPQISRTPSRITPQMRSSPVQNGDLKGSHARNESGGSGAKLTGSTMDEGGLEDSQESREVGNGVLSRTDNRILQEETGTEAASNLKSKVKKVPMKKLKSQALEHVRFDDVREECSCTEEGIALKEEKDELMDIEAVNGKRRKKPLPQRPRKRSRQLFSGDENFGLDALATLADLSLNGLLPSPTVESESSVQVKQEKKENDVFEKAERTMQEVRDSDLQEEKPRISMNRERGSLYNTSLHSVDLGAKEKHHEDTRNADLEGHHVSSAVDLKKRKRKSAAGKGQQVEAIGEICSGGIQKFEALLGEGTKLRNKFKRTTSTNALVKQNRLLKPLQGSASDPEVNASGGHTTDSFVQNTTISQVSLPTKLRSRRKMAPEKVLASKAEGGPESGENIVCNELSEPPNNNVTVVCPHTVTDGASGLKAKLMHCLSSAKLRRWCTYEWFYSAIDLPWFARNEFVEYLNHAGLGHVPRLTRVEWGVIRSSLGKPRRLSKRFLQEEREKLEHYRESVRKHYNEVRAGIRDGLPTDLARPLSVGQRVIACHPKTREIHDGNILTVDRSRCRVQFDRPELGVEFVMDIDCMPLNPLENMPEALRRKSIIFDGLVRTLEDSKLETKSRGWSVGVAARDALNERLDKQGAGPSFVPPSKYSFSTLLKQAKGDTVDSVIQAKAAANEVVAAAQQAMYNQPCTLAQIQAREADIRALAELTRALDKKEALLVELRHMNDEVGSNQKSGETVGNSENFRKQYATVLHQLKDANDQVALALVYLRQRNTYQENLIPPWHRAMSLSAGAGGSGTSDPNASISLDTTPQIGEIVNNSKRRARMMVDAAMQAMSSLKEGEDALAKVGGVLDTATYLHAGVDSGNVAVKLGSSQFDSTRGGEQETMNFRESSTWFGSELPAEDAPDVKRKISSDRKETSLPSELITSCVATLLMIQTCTERQYPPSDVAQMLDSAVTSLQPYSSQNLVIYREIQQSMGIVKNQILALIPTQPSMSVSAELPTASK
eukprot:Gb_37435 [translate_table: standard]